MFAYQSSVKPDRGKAKRCNDCHTGNCVNETPLTYATTNYNPRNEAMFQCVNCNGEINGSISMVCPYCHTNPIIFGSQPYSGVGDLGPVDAGFNQSVFLGFIGAILIPTCPPVGLGLLGLGVVRGI